MARLLTLTQAADELGLSGDTLRWQIRNKRLRATKYGPVWLVTAEEVARYARESRGRQAGGRTAGEGQPRTGRTRMEPARKERPISDSLAQKSDRNEPPKSDSAPHEPPDSDSRLPAMSDRFGIPRPAPKPGKKR